MAEYLLGGVTYRTLEDVKARAQQVMGYFHAVTDPAEDAFLRDLLKRHERYDYFEKRGVGTFHVVMRGEGRWNRGFSFTSTLDGERVDFGYQSCVVAKPRHPLWKAIRAARQEVKLQVETFREKAYAEQHGTCPITKKWYDLFESEVHHEPPFSDLFAAFCKDYTLDDLDVVCEAHRDARPRFKNPWMSAEWQVYHEEHATLTLLSKEGHRIVTHGAPT